MRKEDYIRAKERMEKYETFHEQMEGELKELEETLSQCRSAEKEFQGMYLALEHLRKELEQQLEQITLELEQQEQKKLHIRQERASEQWYDSREQLDRIYEQEEQAETARKKAEEEKQENVWLQECQKAARLWTKIETLQGAADALKLQIAEAQQENETSRRIRDLAYSLRCSWSKRLQEAGEKEEAYMK